MTEQTEKQTQPAGLLDNCVSRRKFLFLGAATVGTITLASLLPGRIFTAEVAAYEGKKIRTLNSLVVGEPVEFSYPWEHPNCVSYLIKLGTPAGGGIGPDQDIVAFNTLCTHMGISLRNTYKTEHQVLGPCPAHLTTFDLTRHGMVVAGHATQGLPQVTLEARGNDIYATGIMALIYGFSDNEIEPA